MATLSFGVMLDTNSCVLCVTGSAVEKICCYCCSKFFDSGSTSWNSTNSTNDLIAVFGKAQHIVVINNDMKLPHALFTFEQTPCHDECKTTHMLAVKLACFCTFLVRLAC